MEGNTQEKDLIEKKESFFSKVKSFFKGLFNKKSKNVTNSTVNSECDCAKENTSFKEEIKVVEDEENKLLELQKKYRRGEIAENDLTEEQIDALSDLYDRQIEALKKVIEEKEKQIAENKIENNNA